ncbi:MAG: ParB/RepB/Spo0J family partition protein [Polyangiaceae bacterium]|nr:ParB/RepB/Spo0J family partition protein [Polyangiaceae bacterium]
MDKQTPQKKRLGRGLDGLLPAPSSAVAARSAATARIEQLHPNRKQPRRRFDDDALEELAGSIREHGLLEPILVRRREEGGYEIIAGERRWRAAQRAGVHELPIYVRELTDAVAFEAALVENLQREDLNPIETALAFQRLIDEHGYTQDQIADRVGKNRATVANALRLLKLPEDVLAMVEDGQLTEGHGRAILTAPDAASMQKLARMVVAMKLSVRETERRARALVDGAAAQAAAPKKIEKSANVKDLERRLSHSLGTPVAFEERGGGKGKLAIEYTSHEELDRILALIMR